MKRCALIVIIVIMVALAAPSLWAGSLAGVNMADQVKVGDATLQLNGMGLRSKLWIKVYVAGLYLENKTSDPASVVSSQQTKRVVMNFMTNKANKKKMHTAWQEGFEENTGNITALEGRLRQFQGYFGNMKEGDKVVMTMIPGTGTEVVINGSTKGTIKGDDFAKALLRVWMGSTPPSDELKEGMLGS